MLDEHPCPKVPLLHWQPPGPYAFAFSSRLGGVSPPPFDSLNLGFSTADRAANVRANRVRLLAAVGANPETCTLTWPQHTTEIVRAKRLGILDSGRDLPGDGVWTDEHDRSLLVLTADCLPIAVRATNPDVIAVVHAGWRGLLADIGTSLAQSLPAGARLSAAIGPSIGPCCFSVSPELRSRFRQRFGTRAMSGQAGVDLRACALLQLASAGCEVEEVFDQCTCCDASFFSHRRDGTGAGRQGVLAYSARAGSGRVAGPATPATADYATRVRSSTRSKLDSWKP